MDLADRRRYVHRVLLIEAVVLGGGAAIAGLVAGLVTGSPSWGFVAAFLWLALLMVVWLAVLVLRPDLRKRVLGSYGQAYRRRFRSN